MRLKDIWKNNKWIILFSLTPVFFILSLIILGFSIDDSKIGIILFYLFYLPFMIISMKFGSPGFSFSPTTPTPTELIIEFFLPLVLTCALYGLFALGVRWLWRKIRK